jgi:hypothetical protein
MVQNAEKKMVRKICKVQMKVNPCLPRRHASQNTPLSLQIKVSFVISGLTQTNHNKNQQPQFTQNLNKTYKQTLAKKKKKKHTREAK